MQVQLMSLLTAPLHQSHIVFIHVMYYNVYNSLPVDVDTKISRLVYELGVEFAASDLEQSLCSHIRCES